MKEQLLRLYTYLLTYYDTRADIRINCSEAEKVIVYVNHNASPYLEIPASRLEAWLDLQGA